MNRLLIQLCKFSIESKLHVNHFFKKSVKTLNDYMYLLVLIHGTYRYIVHVVLIHIVTDVLI